MRRIGIVGSGPMAGYALRQLVASETPLAITVFEADATLGCGMPYRAGMNADEMYCNAFSREIPPLTQRLAPWLQEQPQAFLQAWDLAPEDIDTRSFYPRVLLGEYLSDEFSALCDLGRARGHSITALPRHLVMDIKPQEDGVICSGQAARDGFAHPFDDVVIATGHSWPSAPQIDGVPLVSPWPYSAITELPATRLGILGASLSAVDVLVALGFAHGEFTPQNGQLAWFPAQGSEALQITMVSHNGIMPEPDFYYPHPYAPLRHITAEAVAAQIARGPDDLLARVFSLLIAELRDADPDYLARLGAEAQTIEGFARAYVRHRKELGGLRALREALKQAERSFADKATQGYRYALLRGHENFEPLLDHLTEADQATFRRHLAPVFADCYAAIPHVSVQRVLALYDAGVLDLVATAQDAAFKAVPDGVRVDTIDGPLQVAQVIDARGQPSAGLTALPFPTLAAMIEDVPLRAPYRLEVASQGRVYCLAMPQILGHNPFAQGLANCAEIAKRTVADLLTP